MSLNALENKLSLVSEILSFSSNAIQKDAKTIYRSFTPECQFDFLCLDERVYAHVSQELLKFKPYATDPLIGSLCSKHIVILNTLLDISKAKLGMTPLDKTLLMSCSVYAFIQVTLIFTILATPTNSITTTILSYILPFIIMYTISETIAIPWQERNRKEKETASLLDRYDFFKKSKYSGFYFPLYQRQESKIEQFANLLISNQKEAKNTLLTYSFIDYESVI